jgi:heptaprenyl diphosphate synthase
LLRAHPGLEMARADLRRCADDARDILAPLPDLPAKAALASLCDMVVDRAG